MLDGKYIRPIPQYIAKRIRRLDDNPIDPYGNIRFYAIAEVVNRKYALKFDAYKYSAVDKYPYADVLKYLRIKTAIRMTLCAGTIFV